ncbi:MAG: nucleotidyltransferase domain-containing protein [Candidatus Pacearchaeota archaeon]|nr:nucleotidyltransferase domain-containing protein [Candidatus Pacearchaeota archaeon]
MNNLFGKGREKILECFYRNKTKEIYFNEILRETKLTPNTTLKHLRVLEENGIIASNKKFSNTFYRLSKKNPQTFSLLSYFDCKRLNELPPIRKRAILDFLEKIQVKPLIAVVFGSTAKGSFTKESDIDLLLIYNKKEKKSEELAKEIEATTATKIQTFIIDFDYFNEEILKQKDAVVTHAIKTGFVLTGSYLFYNLTLT